MQPLGRDLTTEEKIFLGNLSIHPGFVVFKKLMDDACQQATATVIKLDPINDPDYDRKLKESQKIARVTNDVCATLIKSIELHSVSGKIEDHANKLKEAAAKVGSVVPELNPGLGSLKIKSPKSDE